MSRRLDPRDLGYDYYGHGYRGSEPYPSQRHVAASHHAAEAGRPPPPHGPPPYYAAPSAYTHARPPPPPAGSSPRAYWPTDAPPAHAPAQWNDSTYRYEAGRYAEGGYSAAAAPPPPPPHAYEPMLRGGPPTQSGYQQPLAQASQPPFSATPFPQAYGPRTRRRPKEQARAACSNCKRDHVSCDNSRPCRRCLTGGKEATCTDVPPKKRGRPKVRPDPVTFAPLPGPSEFRSQRATDQAEVPAQYDPEPTITRGAPPKEALDQHPAKYPPSSWLPRGAQLSPLPSAPTHTAAGAPPPPPYGRPTALTGPRPSPPTHQTSAAETSSPVKHSRAVGSLSAAPAVPLPASSSPPNGFSLPRVGATLPPASERHAATTAGSYGGHIAAAPTLPPPHSLQQHNTYAERPYSAHRTAGGAAYYSEHPPPPPPHNPPIPPTSERADSNPRAQHLPPLSSLHNGRPVSMSALERPEYDFAPVVPRPQPSAAAPRHHRYSWNSPRTSLPLSRGSSSRGDAPRRKSLEPYATDSTAARAANHEPTHHRPLSDGDSAVDADGSRKRQRVTLNEIMH